MLEQSQVEQSIRESQSYLATLQASQQNGTDTVAQIESDIQLAQASDRFESGHHLKSKLAALEQKQRLIAQFNWSQATYEGYLQHPADNGNEAAARYFSPLQAWSWKKMMKTDGWRVWIARVIFELLSTGLPLIAIVAMQV